MLRYIAVIIAIINTGIGLCPPGWTLHGFSCYLINNGDELTFSGASAACRSVKAELASIHDEDTQSFMSFQCKNAKTNLWIGLHDTSNEGEFEWLDGTPYDFTYWKHGEPNDYRSGEDCVHLVYWWVNPKGQWNDIACDNTAGYICQMSKTFEGSGAPDSQPTPFEGSGAPDSQPTLFEGSGAPDSQPTHFDECKQVNPKVCSQGCINLDGGYSCYCQEGYDLINQTYCQAIGPNPLILIADRYLVLEYDPLTREHRTISPNHVNALALDYDIKEMQVYWSDKARDKIYRTNINGSGVPEVVISGTKTHGICIDWIFRNIYWADRNTNTIKVASLGDPSKRAILISDTIHTPEDLTLDPRIGYMFWSTCSGKIERTGMNGEQRLVLVDTDIKCAVGLTADLTTDLLFWVEQHSYSLSSIDYNGHGRRTILSSYSILPRPFGITVFEDYVYLTDWKRGVIIKANKFNGKYGVLVDNLNHPLGIKIYHPNKQINGIINYCEGHNGGCCDLCVAAPKLNDNSVKYSCLCPINSFLLQDGRTCHASEVNPLTPPSSTVGQPEDKQTTQMRTDNMNDVMNPTTEMPPTTLPPGYRCRDGWNSYDKYCYFLSSIDETWSEARDNCRGMGGDLASIHNENENNYINSLHTAASSGRPNIWIGLNDLTYQMSFTWSDDSDMDYTLWNTNEPNNDQGSLEHCVEMYTNKTWHNNDCMNRRRFICKREKENLLPTLFPPTPSGCDQGWIAYDYSCYMFVSATTVTSNSAKQSCRSMAGYLLSINDRFEQAFISSQLGLASGHYWCSLVKEDDGSYTWSDGSSVAYTHWDRGQPDDKNGKCVAVSTGKSAGLWSDAACDSSYNYICEKLRFGFTDKPIVTYKPTDPSTNGCAPGWFGYSNNCYSINEVSTANQLKTWSEASSFCRAQGGNLASFHTAGEEKFIKNKATVADSATGYWIGLSDQTKENGFTWTDGTSVDYTNWENGEPNNVDEEECVEMFFSSRNWDNIGCNRTRHWICKIAKGSMPVTVAPINTPKASPLTGMNTKPTFPQTTQRHLAGQVGTDFGRTQTPLSAGAITGLCFAALASIILLVIIIGYFVAGRSTKKHSGKNGMRSVGFKNALYNAEINSVLVDTNDCDA